MPFRIRLVSFWILCCLPIPCLADSPSDCAIRLTDVTAQTGITFRHNHGGSGQGFIVEGMVAGLVIFDYDDDGLMDIYFLNGAPLKGTVAEMPLRNALYRNNGGWKFTDVTQQAGVGDTHHGLGVTAADYDGDGDLDLYLNNFGPNVLYRNNGDRTFTDVTEQAGVGNGNKVGAGTCFFDMENDGDLDLYVSNYVNFTYENHVPIVIGGQNYQAGPQYYQPVPDTLYCNNGDGTFTDVSDSSGIGAHAGPGMGIVGADFDDDGDVDIFVCHDGAPNFLFRNDGKGKFTEDGLLAGVAYNFNGSENSSMGVDCADYDNDGRLDLFMTDYQAEMPVLYRNLGDGMFEDATSAARITNDLFPHVNWGTGFVDFDNDGDRDLFVACGHFDRIEQIDDRTALRIPNFVLMNKGDGKFIDVTGQSGDGLTVIESSRGAGFDDLDNDGDVDAVILNSHAPPTILRNDSVTKNHWLQIELQGSTANRDAIGARIRVSCGDLVQVSEVLGGRGYQSQFGLLQCFGLAEHEQVERIEVRWPGGQWENFAGTVVDRRVIIEQGTGETE
jgi:hypothetical protein